MGDVFRDVGRVLAKRGLILLALSVALVFTGSFGSTWLRLNPPVDGAGSFVGLANWFASWLVQIAPHSLFIAATSWTVAEVLAGRSPALAETLRQGLRHLLPMAIVQTLYLVGVTLGAVLLIVPGIIVALMWVLAPSALVVDRQGIIESFKRSRALTKGHRWALLGFLVTFSLIVVAIEWMIFQITTPGLSLVRAAAAPINGYGVVPLMTVVTSILNNTIMTAIYVRLSTGYRGSADLTAEVFA
jgi:hypothetical protein